MISAGTSAVRAVKIPHQITPPVSTRRGPNDRRGGRQSFETACNRNSIAAEDLAQLHVCEMVGIDDGPARDGDVDAIQIRHSAEDEEPGRPEASARALFSPGA